MNWAPSFGAIRPLPRTGFAGLCAVLGFLVPLLLATPPIAAYEIVAWGDDRGEGLTTPPAGDDFIAVDGGAWHGIALRENGSLVGWGAASSDAAKPPAGNDYIAIASGYNFCIAMKSDHSIVGWGENGYGQATPPAGNDFIAIAAGNYFGLALRSDKSLVAWGNNSDGQLTVPEGNDFEQIAGGTGFGLALKEDGSLVAWGRDGYDLLSPPAGNDFIAVSARTFQAMALRSDGSIASWGASSWGPTNPPAGNDFTKVSAGLQYGLALRSNGSIVGWGRNDVGQDNPPPGFKYVDVTGGHLQAFALRDPSPENIDYLILHFYNVVLGRDPEAGALDAWRNGYFFYAVEFDVDVRFIGREMGRQFFLSAEYAVRNRTDAEFITDCYQCFLYRAPSAEELNAWLAGTWNRAEAMTIFAESDEFGTIMEWLYSGLTGNPTRNFVTAMYVGVLDRLVDGTGLEAWAAELDDYPNERREKARYLIGELITSEEYTSQMPTNSRRVVNLYRAFMGRFPNDGEVAYWSDELTSGRQTLDEVMDFFAQSDEFTDILSLYFP